MEVIAVELFVRNIVPHMDSSGQNWTESDISGQSLERTRRFYVVTLVKQT